MGETIKKHGRSPFFDDYFASANRKERRKKYRGGGGVREGGGDIWRHRGGGRGGKGRKRWKINMTAMQERGSWKEKKEEREERGKGDVTPPPHYSNSHSLTAGKQAAPFPSRALKISTQCYSGEKRFVTLDKSFSSFLGDGGCGGGGIIHPSPLFPPEKKGRKEKATSHPCRVLWLTAVVVHVFPCRIRFTPKNGGRDRLVYRSLPTRG